MVLSIHNMPPRPPGKNPIQIDGTWNGFGFPDMPNSLRNTGLNDLLAGVKTDSGADLNSMEVQQQHRKCYNMLMRDTRLSTAKILQLLTFDGLPQQLADMCRQAGLTMGIQGQARQLELLRSTRVNHYWELLKAGALGFQSKQVFGSQPFNLVLDYWTLFVQYLMTDQSTAPDTFDIKGCTVGCSTVPVDATQTTLQHILGAKSFDNYVLTGYQTTWLTGFLPADANGPQADVTTIEDGFGIAIDSGDASTFDVKLGDRVIFFGPDIDPAGEKRTVTYVPFDGASSFSVDSPIGTYGPGTSTPTGVIVRKIWYESGLTFTNPALFPGSDMALHTRFLIEEDGGFDKGNGTDTPVGVFVESAITLRVVPD